MQMLAAPPATFSFPSFSGSMRAADRSVHAALNNLNAPAGVENIASPALGLLGNAQLADRDLEVAVEMTVAPEPAMQFAAQARTDVEDGINLITHRLNGPLNTDAVRSDFTGALAAIKSGLAAAGPDA
jgi:hypothetical protein